MVDILCVKLSYSMHFVVKLLPIKAHHWQA